MNAPNRLRLDGAALADNWRTLARLSGGAACGAAVKANGYGLGAAAVVARLAKAGCRDFFVATWAEAAALDRPDLSVSVLHGAREADMPLVSQVAARPVLSTAAQIQRWRAAGRGVCDVMVDTGMNRLGVAPEDVAAGLLDGLDVDVLMSHLASAEEQDAPINPKQRARLHAIAARSSARRISLANSAGIALGPDYALDLTRPGVALYGAVPSTGLAGLIRPVVTIEAEVLQVRRILAGDRVGYNLTWSAQRDSDVAVVNLGYADGYRRALSDKGTAFVGDVAVPVIGRISMDLTAVDVTGLDVAEGDWIAFDPDLPRASAASGVSQYELLTGLGHRFERVWY